MDSEDRDEEKLYWNLPCPTLLSERCLGTMNSPARREMLHWSNLEFNHINVNMMDRQDSISHLCRQTLLSQRKSGSYLHWWWSSQRFPAGQKVNIGHLIQQRIIASQTGEIQDRSGVWNHLTQTFDSAQPGGREDDSLSFYWFFTHWWITRWFCY